MNAQVVCCIAVAALLVLAPAAPGLSPDGLEMIAVARSWVGQGPALAAGDYWPPLWPALMLPILQVLPAETGGRLLNLVLAGLVVVPLFRLGARLGQPYLPVLLYVGLPAVREHAVVLDARPLASLLTISVLAASVEGRWKLAFLLSALAGLTRPEGVMLVPMVAVGALLSGQGWRALVGGALAGVPALLRPGERGWEAFTGPWLGYWPTNDLLALYGANSAPTGYRAYVMAAQAAGIEAPDAAWSNLLKGLPDGLRLLGDGLPSASGGFLLLLAGAGAVELARRGARPVAALLMGASFLGPLVLLPPVRDQATTATNFLFLVPLLCVLAAAAVGRSAPSLTLGLVGLVWVEAHLGPLRRDAPRFFEGTAPALALRAWLGEHPPPTGRVAATLSGRGVVLGAGLLPEMLPSPWEEWAPDPGVGVVITSVDLRGGDGGRGRMLLEDPRWTVTAVYSEGRSARAHWVAYLTRDE